MAGSPGWLGGEQESGGERADTEVAGRDCTGPGGLLRLLLEQDAVLVGLLRGVMCPSAPALCRYQAPVGRGSGKEIGTRLLHWSRQETGVA